MIVWMMCVATSVHVNVLFQEIRKSRILLGKAGIIKEDEEDKEEVR